MRNEYRGEAGTVVQIGSAYGVGLPGEAAEPPAQLPGEPVVFVDREQPLESLNSLLASGHDLQRARNVLISGQRGSGKSALARYWLHRIKSRFEDGQVYFPFSDQGRDTGVRDVVHHCLRTLGVRPECLPTSTEEALGVLRTKTSGKKMVFLFDGAPAPLELARLELNSPDVLVVITSHHQIDRLDGGGNVHIGPLDAESALRLLDRKVGDGRVDAEPVAAARIVELCGALPLALDVVGDLISRHPKWTLQRAVDKLADEDRRLERISYDGAPLVRNALDFVYAQLPERQAMLYRALGVIPGSSFSVWAAAALLDGDPEDTQDDLEELRALSLLECDDQEQYRFHDLVRLHARAFPVPDAEERLLRLAEWYRLHGAYADRAVLEPARLRVSGDDELVAGRPNPFDRDSATRWLERERANILAVLRESARRGWNAIVVSLCDSPLWALHQLHKHYAETIEALHYAVTAARDEQDLVAEARMRTLLVRLHMECGDFDAAHAEAAQARRVAEQSGHRRVQASAAEFHGRVYLEQRRWDEARPLFEFARAVNEELGKPRGMALQEHFLGQVLDGAGRHEEALRTMDAALERLREFPNDRRTPARIRVSMGRAHQHLGRHGPAIDLLRRALSELTDAGASFDLALPLELLARSSSATGAEEEARACLRQALRLYEQAGSPRAERVRSRLE